MATAVVTDSNSGIFGNEARALGIHVIPMPVIIDGHTFFENENISQAEFFEAQMGGKEVSSSQPSPGDLIDLWDMVLQDAEELVYIPMSSGLSGACQTATALAQDYDGKVQVVDNHRISVTMRQAVMRACDLSQEGLGAVAIKEQLEKEAYEASIYIAVDTLKYLKKSGRVTAAGAAVGDLLQIKPVLTIQGGKLDAFAKVRTIKKTRQKMLEAIEADREQRFGKYSDDELMIGGAGTFLSKEDEEEWCAMIRENFPGMYTYYDPLSLSIACHVGPNAMGMGIVLKSGMEH